MMAYAEMRECRHARIADYFGEQGVARRCSACDNCLPERPPEEPIPAAAVSASLAAIARFSAPPGLANAPAVLARRHPQRSPAHACALAPPSHAPFSNWNTHP